MLRSGNKHHLRKSSDRKAQISPVSGMNAFLICAFRSADFLRWCLSSERNLTPNLFFLFPIVFGINLIHFFDEKKDGVAEKSIVCFGASIPCHAAIWQKQIKTKSANFTKNVQRHNGDHLRMEKREVWREKRRVRIFAKGKCDLIAVVRIFGKGKCINLLPILARQWWRHFCLSLSLSLSLSVLSLSLSLCISLSLSLTSRTSRTI